MSLPPERNHPVTAAVITELLTLLDRIERKLDAALSTTRKEH